MSDNARSGAVFLYSFDEVIGLNGQANKRNKSRTETLMNKRYKTRRETSVDERKIKNKQKSIPPFFACLMHVNKQTSGQRFLIAGGARDMTPFLELFETQYS